MKLVPLHIQLYILTILNLFLALGTNYDKIVYLPLLLSVAYTIYTISLINQELLMINKLIDLIKYNKIKGKFKTTSFNFIDFRELISHLNDIVEIHLKTIEKAKYYNQSKKEKEMLSKNINIDELTGLYKRNKFLSDLEQAFRKCFVTETNNLFVAFLDIDKFKNINDNYGHDVGDKVLIHFSNIIKKFVNKVKNGHTNVACRWGGEEFIVMLYGSTFDEAQNFLEDFRKFVEKDEFPDVGHITVSIGYSQILLNDKENIDDLIKRSDQGVYLSKENGRNQTTFVNSLMQS